MIETRRCDDCKTQDMEMFMLKDELWAEIASRRDILCLPCAEKRLGRSVVLHDLKPCQVTYTMFLGAYVGKNTAKLPPDEVLLDGFSHTTQRRFTYEVS